jgi:phage head maturation protease
MTAQPALVLGGHRSATSGMPTVSGHFAVFNRWTEIDSLFEGQFMERFAPGSFFPHTDRGPRWPEGAVPAWP